MNESVYMINTLASSVDRSVDYNGRFCLVCSANLVYASKMPLKRNVAGTSVCGLYCKHMVMIMIFMVILTVIRDPLPACFIKSESLGSEKDKSQPASGHV